MMDGLNISNKSNISLCGGPQQRWPQPGTYTHYIYIYLFPICFVIGTFGNSMILVTLKNVQQSGKAFLSAMALADFLFFIPMFVLSLSAFDFLATDENFLHFSYHALTLLVAIANWFSTASNW